MRLVTCEGPGCEVEFEAARPSAKYHDATCRQRAARARRAEESARPARQSIKKPDGEHAFVTATRKELEVLGSVGSMLGEQVLAIADRMGRGTETGAAMASLSKEHSRLMDLIRAGAKGSESDPVEAARRARAEKASRASKG